MLTWVALLSTLAPAGASVAMMPFPVNEAVDATMAGALTDAIAADLRTVPDLRVVAQSEIQALVSFEKQKDMLGCDTVSCFAEVGGALGVQFLMIGSLSKLGQSWMFHLKLVDMSKASVVAQSDRRLKGADIDTLLDSVPDMVSEIALASFPFSTLAVDSEPRGLQATLNGELIGKTPITARRVRPGSYQVGLRESCWMAGGQSVTVQTGQRQDVFVEAKPRLAELAIQPKDGADKAVAAELRLDGQVYGSAPGSFQVPLCTKQVALASDGGLSWTSVLRLSEGTTTTLTPILMPPAVDPLVLAAEEEAASERRTFWTFLALTAATLGGGLALDIVPGSSKNGHFDALDLAPLGLYLSSGTFGILTLVWGAN